MVRDSDCHEISDRRTWKRQVQLRKSEDRLRIKLLSGANPVNPFENRSPPVNV
jgi:hypothetical protein